MKLPDLLFLCSAALVLAFAFCGCNRLSTSGDAPSGRAAKHDFQYYPNREAYYSPETQVYYWLEGERWRAGVRLPPPIPVSGKGPITITLDTERPYERHAWVKTKYPGKPKD